MRRIFWLRILGVIITILVSGNLLSAEMSATDLSEIRIKLKKNDGQITVSNDYGFAVVLLVIRTDPAGNCSCLEGPPIFLSPQEKQILDFAVRRHHLLAFYRWGFNQPVCILTHDNIEVVKAVP